MQAMDALVLRHLAATLAYRASKVLRDAPPEFATFTVHATTRRPVEIVAHMADLMMWSHTLARGEYAWNAGGSENWDVEVQRFFSGLETFDQLLAAGALPDGAAVKLIQGPLADAFTHVGQLALLRGMAGVSVRPESYAKAEIVVGRVGIAQAPPKREFDGDASRRQG